MKIVIGKILTDTDKIEACRVFDTNTKSTEELSLKKIRALITSGETVVGFKLTHINNYLKGNIKNNLTKERGKFSFNKVPTITGSGDLVNEDDKDILTVYGWKGFAEAKKYICIDYKGQETILNLADFKELVKQNKINGTIINDKTNKLMLMDALDNEL